MKSKLKALLFVLVLLSLVFSLTSCEWVKLGNNIYSIVGRFFPDLVGCPPHTLVSLQDVEATCTTMGTKGGEMCEKCGVVVVPQSFTPVLGHTYTDAEDVNCDRCGFVRSNAPCAHNNVDILSAIASTCTSEGRDAGMFCRDCHMLLGYAILPPAAHTYDGDGDIECNVCSYKRAQGACAHQNTVPLPAVAPTCTRTGVSEGSYCAACHMVLVPTQITEATGHTYKNGVCKSCGVTNFSTGLSFTSRGDGTCYVSGLGSCTDTDVVIPLRSPAGDSVTAVGDGAFSGCKALTSVVFSESCKSLGEQAFAGCTSLAAIEFSDSLSAIAAGAFTGCSSLSEIMIPSSVTEIDVSAFFGCDALAEISVSEENSIYKTIDGNLYSKAGDILLRYAPGKTVTEFALSGSVSAIGECAFVGCRHLKKVTIPSSVATVGAAAFYDCDGLEITADLSSAPTGWHDAWNPKNCTVSWLEAKPTTDSLGIGLTVADSVEYTGKRLIPYTVTKPGRVRIRSYFLKYQWNEHGNLVSITPVEAVVDTGIYSVTVSFSWPSDSGMTDPLPDPISKTFTVTPGSLAAAEGDFGATDIEILYRKDGMDFDPVDSALVTGVLPEGIVRKASIRKLASADATSGEAIGAAITSANGAGYYLVTINYAEEEGHDNFYDENTVSHSAVVYVREIDKVASFVVRPPAVDGSIDSCYGEALFETEYQPTLKDDYGRYSIDTDNLVDPYTKAAALRISKGNGLPDDVGMEAASAKFYAVWDGFYVYIAIEVTDNTPFARSEEYTWQPNPWVNDSVELYYYFGGDNIPDISAVSETYPTYKGIIRDSATGRGGFFAWGSQRSVYFNLIECYARGRDTEGDNTYVIEYKIPARSETWSGIPGATGESAYRTYEGDALAGGDFIFLTYQLNDLMGLPYKRLKDGVYNATEGWINEWNGRWESTAEYDALIAGLEPEKYGISDPWYLSFSKAQSPDVWKWYNFEFDAAQYVYCSGNRSVNTYLNQPGCAPMIIRLGGSR